MSILNRVTIVEDSTFVVLARVTSYDATGSWTGVPGEGYWIKPSDLSSITCRIYSHDDFQNPVYDTSLSPASVIKDPPVTTQEKWSQDTIGYNFEHTLPSAVFSEGDRRYRIEYRFVTTGGSVGWLLFEVYVESVLSS